MEVTCPLGSSVGSSSLLDQRLNVAQGRRPTSLLGYIRLCARLDRQPHTKARAMSVRGIGLVVSLQRAEIMKTYST